MMEITSEVLEVSLPVEQSGFGLLFFFSQTPWLIHWPISKVASPQGR